MSIEHLTKLVGELAEVILFHELDTVDSKAAELLAQVKEVHKELVINDNSMDEWFEELRQENMVNTTR